MSSTCFNLNSKDNFDIGIFPFLDADECHAATHNCHAKAQCMNTFGSFNCTCHPGYYGNGVTCSGMAYFTFNYSALLAGSYMVYEVHVRLAHFCITLEFLMPNTSTLEP